MTISELSMLCVEQLKKGNGGKQVYISNDEEGNGFHFLYYEMMDDPTSIRMADTFGEIKDPDNTIILG